MSDRCPDTITVSGHGPPETLPGLGRAAVVCATVGWIVYLDHGTAKYAFGVLALVLSPALARALISPYLAKVLRSAGKES